MCFQFTFFFHSCTNVLNCTFSSANIHTQQDPILILKASHSLSTTLLAFEYCFKKYIQFLEVEQPLCQKVAN